MTPTETIEIVDRVLATWNKTSTKTERADIYKAWQRLLTDLPIDAVHAAIDTLAVTVDWMPTVGQVRRAAIDHTDPVPAAIEAWTQYRAACEAVRSGTTPNTMHPLVADCARRVGGGLHTNGDRDQFITLYDTLAAKRYKP